MEKSQVKTVRTQVVSGGSFPIQLDEPSSWPAAGVKVNSIPIKDCPVCFRSCPTAAQVWPVCGHLFLSEERHEQRRGPLVPRPKQQQRPRRTHPAAGCRTLEELLQREQERGYKPGWARHVWAARERST